MQTNWRKYGSILIAVIVLWVLVIISAAAYAQSDIVTGTKAHIYSRVLQENREIWIHMPDSYVPAGIYTPQRCPVIYVLDGEAHFNTVSAIVEQLNRESVK